MATGFGSKDIAEQQRRTNPPKELGRFGRAALAEALLPDITVPLLPSILPPQGKRRSQKPFDFFGTLFATPATSRLNPINLLNQTI